MKPLPRTSDTPVLRTDLSDNSKWRAVRAAIRDGWIRGIGLEPDVSFVDDSAFER